jgi:hypothetical protein
MASELPHDLPKSDVELTRFGASPALPPTVSQQIATAAQGFINRRFHLDKGSEKHVYGGEVAPLTPIPVSKEALPPVPEGTRYVWYTPVRQFYTGFQNRLRAEFKKIQEIRSSPHKQGMECLALNVEEVTGQAKVGREYTLQAERAEMTMEAAVQQRQDLVKQKKITIEVDQGREIETPGKLQDKDAAKTPFHAGKDFAQRARFASQYLNGMSCLHANGYVYGDNKLENTLLFTDPPFDHVTQTCRVADFGKTEHVGNDPSEMPKKYTGNLRFAPSDGVLGKKGDAMGHAGVLIRIFEEGALHQQGSSQPDNPDKTMLKEPDRDPLKTKPTDYRRGFERYMLYHPAYLAMETHGGFTNKVKGCGVRVNKLESRYREAVKAAREGRKRAISQQEMEQQKASHEYIDALIARLNSGDPAAIPDTEKAQAFGLLLKKMTLADPEKRMGTEEANQEFTRLFGDLLS